MPKFPVDMRFMHKFGIRSGSPKDQHRDQVLADLIGEVYQGPNPCGNSFNECHSKSNAPWCERSGVCAERRFRAASVARKYFSEIISGELEGDWPSIITGVKDDRV
jgi:hypothetical protein